MTANGILQLAVFLGLILLSAKPMGAYMARVFHGERTLLSPALRPVERLFYRLLGVTGRRGHAVDDLHVRDADVQRRRRPG